MLEEEGLDPVLEEVFVTNCTVVGAVELSGSGFFCEPDISLIMSMHSSRVDFVSKVTI